MTKLHPSTIVIGIPSGPVRGRRVGSGTAFTGLPYATDRGRFRAAGPPLMWTEVRDATGTGTAFVQPAVPGLTDAFRLREDAFSLSVWTPGTELTAPLPVLVWIHGGGFEQGSSALAMTEGSLLAARAGCVVVAVNYRLGFLGFGAMTHLGPRFKEASNLGVCDVASALRWVHDHVEVFGGDPGRVTLVGQSAGAFVAAALLVSPQATGLAHGAALFSGGASRVSDVEAAQQLTNELLEVLGSSDPATLVRTGWKELLAAQRNVLPSDLGIRNGPRTRALGVVMDPEVANPVVPRHPLAEAQAGALAGVPVWMNTMSDEVAGLRGPDPVDFRPSTTEELVAEAERFGLPVNRAEHAVETYLTASTDLDDRLGQARQRLLSDWIYRLPALRLAEAQSGGGGRAWLSEVGPHECGAAAHGDEVAPLFGRALPSDRRWSRALHEALTRFVHDGDPGWAPFSRSRRVRVMSRHHVGDHSGTYEQAAELWEGVPRP